MIRFGPAGIPLSCKGRTLKDGVEDVHTLSLTALEVQMIRSETAVIYPEEEDIGLTMKDIEDRLVVEIVRDGEPIIDPDEPIEEDDSLVIMISGVTFLPSRMISAADSMMARTWNSVTSGYVTERRTPR